MMADRCKPREKSLYLLKQTVLGFCNALAPPKIFLPSQTGNRYSESTEIHERCHAILINSTIYGIAEQILTYLLKSGCPHIQQHILNQAFNNCIKNSFIVHEGCATLFQIGHIQDTQPENLNHFKTTIPHDYQYAVSRLSDVVSPFGFDGYLRDWLAMQIAAVCLCPPLFGPLSDYGSYKKGVISIFGDKNFSPDIRLEKIISDGKSRCFSKLIKKVKNVIESSIQKTFSSSRKPNFNDDFLRHNFVRICEPLIEKCFTEAYPRFYVNYHAFLKKWKKITWPKMISAFWEGGCSCLSHFSFKYQDLSLGSESTRPVAIPNRKDHAGAIELDKLSDLPIQINDQYYMALHFCEKPETQIICYNPLRLLHEGHLYLRLRRFHKTGSTLRFESFYWFKFFIPPKIPDALASIAKIPGIVIYPACGDINRIIARLKQCNRCSIRNVYLQIDGITAENFLRLTKILPSLLYKMFIMEEKTFCGKILYLKDTLCNFHIILPITLETLATIAKEVNHIKKIDKRQTKPKSTDTICSYHLFIFGW